MSGATSEPLPICSGVPEGSILGPALFLLYVNDLPDAVEESNIAMSADDSKIYKEVKSAADVVSLQSDLNRIEAWSKDSGLTFNETKCKAKRISRKLKPIESSYSIKGKVLESVVAERDVGGFVANDLTWSKQVFEQSCRAKKSCKVNLDVIKDNKGDRSISL